MPRARRKAKEAQTEEREAEETAPAPSRGLGLELPELPAGWSRYFDPRHGTYLYHEATGDWHLEAEADKVLAESGREARVEADSTAWPELGASEVKELHGGGAKKGPAAFKEAAKEAARLPAPKRPPVPPIPEGRGSEPSAPGGLAGTVPASGELMGAACSTEWGDDKALPEEEPGMPGYRGSKALAARKAKAHLTVRHWHDKMMMSAASQAVFEGAQRGDAKKVTEALNAHGDPNCINFGGFNALMLAVGGGYMEVIALLLQASANPNNGKSGLTPLMIAASSGQLEVARMLVNCGAAATGHCELDGRTALHGAARRGHSDVAKLLVQAGASVDIGDWQECTALMLAAQEGHGDVLKVLLCAGASVSLSNKSGDSALSACVKSGHEACLETMLRAGAPVNAANKSTGNSALAEASRVGSEAMVRKLLQYQANVNFANLRKETPLMLAAAAGHEQVVRMLLVSGANTAAEDVNGHTPIMHAAVSNVAVVQALLDFGGNPSVVSQVDCNTPSTVAAMHGRKQCYDLLVWAGAFVPALEENG
ncbi:ANK1 [Symbiodinium sp. KB8]|nr:ANK1 [Symbiodinium sp. KB8]